MHTNNLIIPKWDAPSSVKAFTTSTAGGFSNGYFSSFNLGMHVNDNQHHVQQNRDLLQQHVGVDKQLCWLHQTHSDIIISASNYENTVEGDASVSNKIDKACVVMTADCLPVFLCNETGTMIAAIHCGWKGLRHNLIKKTIRKYFADDSVIAWLGPAIGAKSYEVDEKLHAVFTENNPHYESAFNANRKGHYLFDLYAIAKQQLHESGVDKSSVFGGDCDTFSDTRFYSYRRNPSTGRMASVIYFGE